MGILNLLKELQPATKDTHLSEWSGHTLGVDAMGWLHRSAFSCAMELARNEADPAANPHPLAYLRWLRRMLHMCRTLGVRLLVVFDGAPLPAKSGTNAARDALRASYRARADSLYASGARDAAAEMYGRCASVSAAMRRNFQHLLRSEGVPFIVAPFEADAQLAHLYRCGCISGAITEDSDLLAFGCERLLLKLDRDGNARLLTLRAVVDGDWHKTAEAVLFKMQRILRAHRNDEDATAAGASSSSASAAASSLSSSAASLNSAAASSSAAAPVPSTPPLCVGHTRFMHACVLSGCDYLASLHGIGLKKAVALVDEHRLLEPLLYFLKDARKKLETKWRKDREKAARAQLHAKHAAASNGNGDDGGLRSSPSPEEEEAAVAAAADDTDKMSTAEYIAHFYRAVLTFQHQLVYDAATATIVHLTPLPPQLQELWERSLRSDRHPTTAATKAERDVHVIDSDDDDGQQEVEDREAAALRVASAAFPSFRDVTEATAAHAAQLEGLPPPPLPAAHPLLQLRSFAFLGSPLPPHVDTADWIAGRINPRTMRSYPPGFKPIDLAAAERASTHGGSAGKDQGRGGFRRQSSAAAVSSAPAASKAKSNFFGRSASASSSSAASPSPLRTLKWTCGTAAPRQPFCASAAVTSSRRQEDLGELEGLFGGANDCDDADADADDAAAAAAAVAEWDPAAGEDDGVMAELLRQDAATAATAAEDEAAETQRLDELDDETAAPVDAPLRPAATVPQQMSSSPAVAPSSPLNPFACALRPVDDVPTFADVSADSSSAAVQSDASLNASPAAPFAATLSASSALGKLLGLGSTAAAAAASKPPSRPFFVIKQGAIAQPQPQLQTQTQQSRALSAPCIPAPLASRAPSAAPGAMCDLTSDAENDDGECDEGRNGACITATPAGGKTVTAMDSATASSANANANASALVTPPLKRKASAPASTHSSGPARRTSPIKRKKSTPANGSASASGSLLSFFRKST